MWCWCKRQGRRCLLSLSLCLCCHVMLRCPKQNKDDTALRTYGGHSKKKKRCCCWVCGALLFGLVNAGSIICWQSGIRLATPHHRHFLWQSFEMEISNVLITLGFTRLVFFGGYLQQLRHAGAHNKYCSMGTLRHSSEMHMEMRVLYVVIL